MSEGFDRGSSGYLLGSFAKLAAATTRNYLAAAFSVAFNVQPSGPRLGPLVRDRNRNTPNQSTNQLAARELTRRQNDRLKFPTTNCSASAAITRESLP